MRHRTSGVVKNAVARAVIVIVPFALCALSLLTTGAAAVWIYIQPTFSVPHESWWDVFVGKYLVRVSFLAVFAPLGTALALPAVIWLRRLTGCSAVVQYVGWVLVCLAALAHAGLFLTLAHVWLSRGQV